MVNYMVAHPSFFFFHSMHLIECIYGDEIFPQDE